MASCSKDFSIDATRLELDFISDLGMKNNSVSEIKIAHKQIVDYLMSEYFDAMPADSVNSIEFNKMMNTSQNIFAELVMENRSFTVYDENFTKESYAETAVKEFLSENKVSEKSSPSIEPIQVQQLEPKGTVEDQVQKFRPNALRPDKELLSLQQIIDVYLKPDGNHKLGTELTHRFKRVLSSYLVNDQINGSLPAGVNHSTAVQEFVSEQGKHSNYDSMINTISSIAQYQYHFGNDLISGRLHMVSSHKKSFDPVEYTMLTEFDDGILYQHNTVQQLDGEDLLPVYVYKSKKRLFNVSQAIDDLLRYQFLRIGGTPVEPSVLETISDTKMFTTTTIQRKKEDALLVKDRMLDNIIAEQFDSLLSAIYPALYQGHAAAIRTGFLKSNQVTIYSGDQESKRISLLKSTTRRVKSVKTVNGRKVVTMDSKDPFLSATEFHLVSEELRQRGVGRAVASKMINNEDSILINDKQSLKVCLKERINSEAELRKTLYQSIYYRFFADEDYTISEDGETTTHRSLTAIIEHNSHESVGLRGYNNKMTKGMTSSQLEKSLDTRNADLKNLLNSFVTAIGSDAYTTLISNKNGDAKLGVKRNHAPHSTFYDELTQNAFRESDDGSGTLIVKGEIKDLMLSKKFFKYDTIKQTLTIRTSPTSKDSITFDIKVAKLPDPEKSEKAKTFSPTEIRLSSDGVPFVITGIKGNATLPSITQLLKIFRAFGVPATINENTLLVLKEHLKSINENDKFGSEEFLVINFLANIAESINKHQGTSLVPSVNNQIHGYNNALDVALEEVLGKDKNLHDTDSSGNLVPTQEPRSKLSEYLVEIDRIRRDTKSGIVNRNVDSFIINNQVEILQVGNKSGFVSGTTQKGVTDLTVVENMRQAHEDYFLGRLDNSGGSKFIIQPMNMGDRRRIPVFVFSTTSTNDGGYAVGPRYHNAPLGPQGLDIVRLETQWLHSQQSYMKNYEKGIIANWKSILIQRGIIKGDRNIRTIEDLAKIVKNAQLSYSDISENTQLTKAAYLTQDGDYAVIPQANINRVIFYRDQKNALAKTKLDLQIYKEEVKKAGYIAAVMEPAFVEKLTRYFGGLNGASNEDLHDALLTMYFYAQSTVGTELARILNGGEVQYKQPDKELILDFSQGIDEESIMKQVLSKVDQNIKNYGKDKTQKFYQEVLKLKDRALIAKIVLNDQIGLLDTPAFIDQLKRNAMLGTTGQSPTLVSDNERGALLSSHSKTATIEEFKVLRSVLGIAKPQKIDPYDGVMLTHVLHQIFLNNSLGNGESGYSSVNGSAVKAITLSTDKDGNMNSEKKAEFGAFNHEMTLQGDPTHLAFFEAMNRAVSWGNRELLVHKVHPDGTLQEGRGSDFTTIVTTDMWLNNGHNLGVMMETDERGRHSTITVEQILAKIKNGEMTLTQLQQNIADEKYFTNKQVMTFDNVQELWEYFGSTENAQAWYDVAQVLGDTSVSEDLELKKTNYDIRNKVILKVGHASQVKTGLKGTISAASFLDPTTSKLDLSKNKKWNNVLNNHNLVILNAAHNPDVTSRSNFLQSESEEYGHASRITLIRQVINANKAQGRSMQESINIQEGLASLSFVRLDIIRNKIKGFAVEELRENYPKLNEAQLYEVFKGEASFNFANAEERAAWEQENIEYLEVLTIANKKFANELLKEQIRVTGGNGLINELIAPGFIDKLSYELNQILPFTQGKIYAAFNKAGIQLKFNGGQYVVSPSESHISTFSLNGKDGRKLGKLTKKDLNGYSYGTSEKIAILPLIERENMGLIEQDITSKNIHKISLADFVIPKEDFPAGEVTFKAGMPVMLASIKAALIQSGDKSRISQFVPGNFTSRILDIIPNRSEDALKNNESLGEKLTWQTVIYEDADGKLVDIKNTPEYEAYGLADQIVTADRGLNNEDVVRNKKLLKAFYVNSELRKKLSDDERQNLVDTYTTEETEKFEEYFTSLSKDDQEDFIYDTMDWVSDESHWLLPALEMRLESMLHNDIGEYTWYTEPAEFYSPPLSGTLFYLKPGDTVREIQGSGPEPNLRRLVLDGTLTYAEMFTVQNFYSNSGTNDALTNGKALLQDKKSAYEIALSELVTSTKGEDITDEIIAQIDTLQKKIENINVYNTAQLEQHRNSASFFSSRVRENIMDNKDFDFDIHNRSYSKTELANIETRLRKLRSKYSFDAMLSAELDKALIRFLDIANAEYEQEEFMGQNQRAGDLMELFGLETSKKSSWANKFINTKATVLAQNFNMSLQFVTGRIPSQGKQSYISGKIKAFVHEQHNASFSALELLIITGADYDIDKQNLMTYQFGDSGENVIWAEYTEDGTLDSPVSQRLFKQRLEKELESVTDVVEIEAIRSRELKLFNVAVHNSVIYNLTKSIQDPVNFIEASTQINPEMLEKHVLVHDYTGLYESLEEGQDPAIEMLSRREHASMLNPFSMFKFERLAHDGKDGIAITAKEMRAYLYVYQGFISSASSQNNDFYRFRSQFSKDQVDKISKVLKQIDEDAVIDLDAIQFVTVDEEGKYKSMRNLPTIANARMFIGEDTEETQEFTERTKDVIAQLQKVGKNSDAQYEILQRHAKDVNLLNNIRVEPQVWEELSAILSAATDNAKLLILGRISVDNTTNAIVSTMLHAGVRLDEALGLIREVQALEDKDSSVRILKAVYDHRDTSKKKSNPYTPSTLTKAIEHYRDKKKLKGINLLTDPAMRLYAFAKLSDEFSVVGNITSISTGMAVPRKDSFKFFYTINNKINSALNDYKDKHGPNSVDRFDIELFIKGAIAERESNGAYVSEYAKKAIKDYNLAKAGINIPFILQQTPDLFYYFLTAFEAKRVFDSLSQTNSIVEKVLTTIDEDNLEFKEDSYSNSLRKVDSLHDDVRRNVVGITIDLYYKDQKKRAETGEGPGSIIRLDGYDAEFDLSLREASGPDSQTLGRKEFVEIFGTYIKDEYKDILPENTMVMKLASYLRTDARSQETIPIMKGVLLNDLEKDEFEVLRNEMAILKEEHPNFYQALFNYTLIVDNGKFGGGSLAGLMFTDVIEDYSVYLQSNMNEVARISLERYTALAMLSPDMLPMYSTKKSTFKSKAAIALEEEHRDNMEQDNVVDDMDANTRRSNKPKYIPTEDFVINKLNENKLLNDTGYPDMFVSSDNHLVYKWMPILHTYVPWFTNHHRAVNIFDTSAITDEAFLGSRPGVVIKTVDGREITVYKFVDDAYATQIRKNKKGVAGITAQFIKTEAQYVISDNGGANYRLMTKVELDKAVKDSNSPVLLKEDMITIKSVAGERSTHVASTMKLYIQDGNILLEKPASGVYVEKIIPMDAGRKVSGDTKRIIYAPELAKTVNTGLLKAKGTALSIDDNRAEILHAINTFKYAMEIIRTKKSTSFYLAYTLGQAEAKKNPVNFITEAETLEFIQTGFEDVDAYLGQYFDKETKTVIGSFSAYRLLKSESFLDKNNKTKDDLVTLEYIEETIKELSDRKNMYMSDLRRITDNINSGIYTKFLSAYITAHPEYDIYIDYTGEVKLRKSIRDRVLRKPTNKKQKIFAPIADITHNSNVISTKVIRELSARLEKALPNTSFLVLSGAEIEGDAEFGVEDASEIRGFVSNGTVIFNSDLMTINTPLHEYSHVYFEYLKVDDPALFAELIEHALNTPLASSIREAYPELSETDLGEEILAELVARSQTETFKDNDAITRIEELLTKNSVFDRVFDYLTELFQRIFKTDITLSHTDTMNSIIGKIGTDMLKGKGSILSDFSEKAIDMVDGARLGEELTLDKAKDILLKHGYIYELCV